jgi:hypothetical protein
MGGLSKNKLKQSLSKIFRLSSWKIVLILILLGFLTATLMRFDHIKMTELRDAVMAADAENNDEKIASALEELRAFTLKHIIFNTVEENGVQKVTFGTGPFYLENQYLRKANEAIDAAKAELERNSSNPNGNIYKKVADICDARSRANGWGFNARYIQCYQDELAKYPEISTMDVYGSATLPSTELFRHEYSSPLWYPCWSGICLLICIILALILIVRLVIWLIIHLALLVLENNHKK